ncbi:MAG: sigma-70 family RNA polymerase sigma factor [Planctomycetota bacterium]|nr:sigma-70 family RNA polymerase sigma factor [Planctomycetota bacterium]
MQPYPPATSTPACAEDFFAGIRDADLRSLHKSAQRLLGCEHLAHDVVQEALLALSQEPERPQNPIGWLARAVTFRSRHMRRTNRRRVQREHKVSQHCQLHEGCDNPLHVAIAHEIGEQLGELRKTLPSEQRQVLDLYESRGLDYQQIANHLCVPIGTVRSRLARARQSLRMATSAIA